MQCIHSTSFVKKSTENVKSKGSGYFDKKTLPPWPFLAKKMRMAARPKEKLFNIPSERKTPKR